MRPNCLVEEKIHFQNITFKYISLSKYGTKFTEPSG